jgi:phosphoribosyl-AMP cyclohydrolase / phosphoribosyl-ATP pyrophosphohydrolase
MQSPAPTATASWLEALKFGPDGLVAVVAQEATTGEVLMVAWANREALERTAASGRAHYWSRSRAEVWRKGDTSGHTQEVREILVDCDGDALIYRIRQQGAACHTGERTCFFRRVDDGELAAAPGTGHILERVDRVIARRAEERPEGSYTTYLLEKGLDKVLKKLGEETTEVVVAAKNESDEELRAEVSDLLFHLLVLLRLRGLPLEEVWGELEARFGAAPRPPSSRASSNPHS